MSSASSRGLLTSPRGVRESLAGHLHWYSDGFSVRPIGCFSSSLFCSTLCLVRQHAADGSFEYGVPAATHEVTNPFDVIKTRGRLGWEVMEIITVRLVCSEWNCRGIIGRPAGTSPPGNAGRQRSRRIVHLTRAFCCGLFMFLKARPSASWQLHAGIVETARSILSGCPIISVAATRLKHDAGSDHDQILRVADFR